MEASPLLVALARHAERARPGTARSAAQLEGARAWLCNALARALTAGRRPELAHFVKPLVPGGVMPGGARVPGTSLELDPVQAAFVNALLTGWECAADGSAGHPCQHVGALLAVCDAQGRQALMRSQPPLTVGVLLGALLTSHEIQASLAGLPAPLHGRGDPTLLLGVAQAAVITVLLGGSFEQCLHAVTQAFIDGVALPTPREGADRRAADRSARAARLALLTMAGEPGYPLALDAPAWGFHAVVRGDAPSTAAPTAARFAAGPLPQAPGGSEAALAQLLNAASQAFRPQQLERIHAWFSGPLERLDSRGVSELMAQLATHAARESSRQLALLP